MNKRLLLEPAVTDKAAAPAPAAPATPAQPTAGAGAAPAQPATPPAAATPTVTATASPWSVDDKGQKPADDGKKPDEPAKPAVPEKYSLKKADGSDVDPADVERLSALGKATGLTNDQLQAVYKDREGYREVIFSDAEKVNAKQNQDWLGELQQKWGDKFKENAEIVKRTWEAADPKGEFRAKLKRAHLDNEPGLTNLILYFGNQNKVLEDRMDAARGAVPDKDNRTAMQKLRAEYDKEYQEHGGKK